MKLKIRFLLIVIIAAFIAGCCSEKERFREIDTWWLGSDLEFRAIDMHFFDYTGLKLVDYYRLPISYSMQPDLIMTPSSAVQSYIAYKYTIAPSEMTVDGEKQFWMHYSVSGKELRRTDINSTYLISLNTWMGYDGENGVYYHVFNSDTNTSSDEKLFTLPSKKELQSALGYEFESNYCLPLLEKTDYVWNKKDMVCQGYEQNSTVVYTLSYENNTFSYQFILQEAYNDEITQRLRYLEAVGGSYLGYGFYKLFQKTDETFELVSLNTFFNNPNFDYEKFTLYDESDFTSGIVTKDGGVYYIYNNAQKGDSVIRGYIAEFNTTSDTTPLYKTQLVESYPIDGGIKEDPTWFIPK